MMDSQQPWYESFFGRDYLDVYDLQFSQQRTLSEVAFAEQTLDLHPGQSLLDLGAGPGRHAVVLAQRGYEVHAQDLSREYLTMAEKAAADAKVELTTVHSDMRDIPFTDRFDAVINMFSAFGYLESEDEDARVLEAVAAALKPGGRLLMDMINREWVVLNYIQKDWHKGQDGTTYLEYRELDLTTSRNHVTFTALTPEGSAREIGGHHIRLYTLTEMIALLRAAGLSFEQVLGSFDSEPYSLTSRRMIVLARKDA